MEPGGLEDLSPSASWSRHAALFTRLLDPEPLAPRDRQRPHKSKEYTIDRIDIAMPSRCHDQVRSLGEDYEDVANFVGTPEFEVLQWLRKDFSTGVMWLSGQRGAGKTACLHHVLFFLVPQITEFSDLSIVYIDFNSLIDLHDFRELARMIGREASRAIDGVDSHAISAIAAAKTPTELCDAICGIASEYESTRHGQICLVFDNSDHLNFRHLSELLSIARQASNRTSLRIIISLRPPTVEYVLQNTSALGRLPTFIVTVASARLTSILKSRLERLELISSSDTAGLKSWAGHALRGAPDLPLGPGDAYREFPSYQKMLDETIAVFGSSCIDELLVRDIMNGDLRAGMMFLMYAIKHPRFDIRLRSSRASQSARRHVQEGVLLHCGMPLGRRMYQRPSSRTASTYAMPNIFVPRDERARALGATAQYHAMRICRGFGSRAPWRSCASAISKLYDCSLDTSKSLLEGMFYDGLLQSSDHDHDWSVVKDISLSSRASIIMSRLIRQPAYIHHVVGDAPIPSSCWRGSIENLFYGFEAGRVRSDGSMPLVLGAVSEHVRRDEEHILQRIDSEVATHFGLGSSKERVYGDDPPVLLSSVLSTAIDTWSRSEHKLTFKTSAIRVRDQFATNARAVEEALSQALVRVEDNDNKRGHIDREFMIDVDEVVRLRAPARLPPKSLGTVHVERVGRGQVEIAERRHAGDELVVRLLLRDATFDGGGQMRVIELGRRGKATHPIINLKNEECCVSVSITADLYGMSRLNETLLGSSRGD